jgi:hypothetical protein
VICTEFERAFLGELVEPSVIPWGQVVVGEVVESESPNGTAHRAELPVDRIVVSHPVELVQTASELDARQDGVVCCKFGHVKLLRIESGATTIEYFRSRVHEMFCGAAANYQDG